VGAAGDRHQAHHRARAGARHVVDEVGHEVHEARLAEGEHLVVELHGKVATEPLAAVLAPATPGHHVQHAGEAALREPAHVLGHVARHAVAEVGDADAHSGSVAVRGRDLVFSPYCRSCPRAWHGFRRAASPAG
jgi:hypothetical protein